MEISILPYLKDPLVLIGLFLILGVGIIKTLVKGKILSTISQRQSSRFLHRFMLLGFISGLLIILLGFFIKYKQISNVNPVQIPEIVKSVMTDSLLSKQHINDIQEILKDEMKDVVREVEYGFVHLTKDVSIEIQSARNERPLKLYGGDEFEYHIFTNYERPRLYLNVGARKYRMDGEHGRIKVVGVIHQPMEAYLLNPDRGSQTDIKFTVYSVPR